MIIAVLKLRGQRLWDTPRLMSVLQVYKHNVNVHSSQWRTCFIIRLTNVTIYHKTCWTYFSTQIHLIFNNYTYHSHIPLLLFCLQTVQSCLSQRKRIGTDVYTSLSVFFRSSQTLLRQKAWIMGAGKEAILWWQFPSSNISRLNICLLTTT